MNNWITALLESDLLQEVDSDDDLQALKELAHRLDQASEWICDSPILNNLNPNVADVISRTIGHTSEAVTAWHKIQIEEWDQERADRARETEQQRLDATLNARAYLRSVM